MMTSGWEISTIKAMPSITSRADGTHFATHTMYDTTRFTVFCFEASHCVSTVLKAAAVGSGGSSAC
eukprot:3758370-Karenia_brevis.AAC.1